MKEKFIKLLTETCEYSARDLQADNLILALEQGGFFKSPCSGGFHLCKEGGLLEHSLNVAAIAIDISETLGYGNKDSVIIAALLHDVGKMGQYGKANYVPNLVKDGRVTKADPVQKYKISDTKPFETNKELLYVDHEIRSIQIVSQYLDLTEEESFAILYHNGMYSNLKYALNGKETPLQMIIHFADLWASRVVENVKEAE